jgi:hypothetical protein
MCGEAQSAENRRTTRGALKGPSNQEVWLPVTDQDEYWLVSETPEL